MRKKLLDILSNLKFSQKLFLIYSMIILLVIISLSLIVSGSITSMLIEKELKYNQFVLINIDNFIQDKINTIAKFTTSTYIRSSTDNKNNILGIVDFIEDPLFLPAGNIIDSKSDFSKYFDTTFSLDRDLSGVIIYKKVNETLLIFSKESRQSIDARSSLYSHRFSQLNDPRSKVHIYPTVNSSYPESSKTYSLSVNLKTLDTLKTVGILMFDFDFKGIQRLLSQYYQKPLGDTVVLTENGEVIYDSKGVYEGKVYPYFELLQREPSRAEVNGEDCLINISRENDAKVIVASIIPRMQIVKGINTVKQNILILAVIFIITGLILAYIGTLTFSRRVKSITSTMRKVRKGDFSLRIPLERSNDEINEIASNFNNMCSDIEKYINKVYVAELHQKTSELKQKSAQLLALQAQINPHFLYNTLETIRMKAMKDGSRESAEMILILSKLFRNSVKSDTVIDIQEEILQAKLYMELFQIRYGDSLSAQFTINPEILEYGIIRHIIQPILENYMIHGFVSSRNDNWVKINGYKDKIHVYFDIVNNGILLEDSELVRIKEGLQKTAAGKTGKIGLTNVKERIRLIYGDTCGIGISSEPSNGITIVRITILPIKKKELTELVQGITG